MSHDATKEWLHKHGLRASDARRLERALCALADFEGPIKAALAESGGGNATWAHPQMCAAIRFLIDVECDLPAPGEHVGVFGQVFGMPPEVNDTVGGFEAS